MHRRSQACAVLVALIVVSFLGAQGSVDPSAPPSLLGISGGGAVELGQTVNLTVNFVGSGTGQSYQWRKNGADIDGATRATHTIAAAAPGDAGTYNVSVRNAIGESVATTELTVRPAAAPVITTQPRTTVAQVGQPVTFSFVATGSHPRTYQWRKDMVPIAGANLPTLLLPSITTADAGAYSVVVTNTLGSATSASALLTVNAATPPVISSYSPSDGTYTEGQAVTLGISLSSGSFPFTYQWMKNGAPIPGATSSQLSFTAVRVTDAGRYSVTLTNAAGTATSREANIVVNRATPVSISSHPTAVTVFEGQSASFYVGVNGSSPMTIQWLKNGAPIPNATSSSLHISSARASDAGSYSATVTNIAGTATSNAATLVVNPPVAPTITTQPRDASVTEGESTSLSVAASGSPPLSYQWYFNGVRVTSGGTSSSFYLSPRLADAGNYHVVVTNPAGAVTSRTAVVAVSPQPPPPVLRLYNQTATLGSSFSISGSYYSSGGTVTYQWYRNGQPIPQATSSSFSVSSARAEDAGDYFVVVTTSGGSTTSRTGRVTVTQPGTPPAGAWVAAERSGDVVHFVFANPARIERFNLATESWLAPVPLSRSAAAFAVTASAYYLASGSIVYRYALDGTGETVLSSAFASDVQGLAVFREFLLVQSGGYSSPQLSVLRMSDGVRVSSATYTYRWGPQMAVAPNQGRAFSRTTGISPSDITMTTISAQGIVGTSATESPYHGDFPDATRLFVSPDESYVVDDSGTAYRTSDLRFVGGLGGRLDDVAFAADGRPVVLRGGMVSLLNSDFNESGRAPVGIPAAKIFVRGDVVFAFGYPPSGGQVERARLPLSQLGTPPVAPAIDAATTPFTPDTAFVDRDGVLHLYSKLHRQLFRWSTGERRYLSPLPLQGWPDFVTYSATNHRIYLGYADNRILQIRLDAGRTLEEPFAVAPQQVMALSTAGEYVFLVDPSGAWVSYFLFAPDGRMLAQRDWSYLASDYAWNPVLRRFYHFRDDSSPNDLIYTEVTAAGAFGRQQDSPYHGEIETRYPIRVAPDGGSVLLGSGKFYDAATLVPNNSLANRIEDATWINQRLFTARTTTGGTEIQRWGGNNYALDRTKTIAGRPIRIFTLANARLLVVTVRDGMPMLTTLDQELNELSTDAGGPPTRLANLAARALAGRGAQMLIPGFVVTGTQPKRMLVRAAGPALTAFGVTDALADPQLAVYNGAGVIVASNDNWSSAANLTDLLAVSAKVGAFAFESGSRDAAALVSLEPGAYTVQTRGANDTTGVALVEVYDAQDTASTSRLINISARAQVGTGADVLIPGIVIQGNGAKTLLIRAVGPALTAFGVTGALANPKLRLFRGEQLLQENDDWEQVGSSAAGQVAGAAVKSGAFALPAGGRDAALLLTLGPGSYTAHVSGADGGTGVALVEVYEVP